MCTSGPADASSGPSRGEAAARCGSIRNRKFMIQNSIFKIKRRLFGYAWAYIPVRAAACGGHARSGPSGRELRASAGRRLRPADLLRGRFHLQGQPAAERMGCTSGPAGRKIAALRPGAAAGCSTSPTSNLLAGVFSKTGDGCGLRRLLIEAANSKCNIQDSKLPLGTQPAEDTQLRL